MGVTGDFAKLEALERDFAKLDAASLKTVYRVMVEETRSLVTEAFARSAGPSGAWAPLKRARRRGGSKPLLDTGRLRASITYQVTADGYVVSAPVVYAAAQNFGQGPLPARPFLPSTPLSGEWARRLEEAARDTMDAIVPTP